MARGGWIVYWTIRYVRSPASFLEDSTARPIFFVMFPLMKLRILWLCRFVVLAIFDAR